MKKNIITILLFIIILIIGHESYLNTNKNQINIINKSINGVVSIIGENDFDKYQKDPIGYINNYNINKKASGFFIRNDGLIITNKHILDKNNQAQKYIIITNDNKKYLATKVYKFKSNDIAILKININNINNLNITNGTINIGEEVIAIGNIYGELGNSVSKGIISGLNRNIKELGLTNLIQTDLNLYPGNSGGPLINSKGEVIGINTAKINKFKNIGFAIPINKKTIDNYIKKSGF